MVETSKIRVILFWLGVGLTIVLIVIGIIIVGKHDNEKTVKLEKKATPIGLNRAKEECRKEGLSPDVCNTITGSAGTSECHGQICWIVYAHSEDEKTYRASITVALKDGKYAAVDYLRDTSAQE